jgi:hypothetical protein
MKWCSKFELRVTCVFAVCCAALQSLDESEAMLATVSEQLTALEDTYARLQRESKDIHRRTEGLLAENLDSLVESAGKLTIAQVGGLAAAAC